LTFTRDTLNNFVVSLQDCYGFVYRATVVREQEEYWMNVTSSRLRHDVNCDVSAATVAMVSVMLLSQLLLIVFANLVFTEF